MTTPHSSLFSEDVAFVTSTELPDSSSLLLPAEQAALGSVSDRRRDEFTAGRRCSHHCMEILGRVPAPVLIGTRREPVWPAGLLGSITHTASFAAAAVASTGSIHGIGLDAEPDAALPDGVLERISTADERARIRRADPTVSHPDRLLFCAKEATYKVWYPVARRWLGFEDVSIEFDRATCRLAVDVLVDGPFKRLEGRYSVEGGLIIVGIELRPGDL